MTSKAMTPREGRDAVVDFVIGTTKQLHITGWWPRSGPVWADECGLGGGVLGASYSYDHWAPRGTDHQGDAERVAAYWESLGMSVRITDSTPSPTVYGSGGPVLRADFDTNASDNSYSGGALAPCSPGDAWELNEEDGAERDRGKVLPGDEGVIPWEQWNTLAPSPRPSDPLNGAEP
ncbi:hypothetical protein O159_21360 [Leifsonia xyli subsp. cynodontis DSM 46306]|uniref:Uncharacterized protein n=1 Tax=Leifsonia xyli subsp. cynodontis DSM 46306 TaxID=1389489 RepID=U3PER9_LEIXC|nr:hypothetical protein [Leifsonia xyli]AGW42078.1 hypothetical protein O159_20960 [Leifsonia xyli subsp. cynodontis DSM 46306]AGW42118.1 hypothetical protein O159_21360 [Leifsonia xyli subsp. cynodontis DSM 46306]